MTWNLRDPDLSQKVIFSHHVPVPDLHDHSPLLTQLLCIQLQLQGFSPMREASLLDNLESPIKKIRKNPKIKNYV